MRSLPTIAVLVLLLAAGVCVPALAGVSVFTDRATWESYVSEPMQLEDFETDPLSYSVTPYETAHGALIEGVDGVVDVFIVTNGKVNGSRELWVMHGEVEFSFPHLPRITAFAFQWTSILGKWKLRVDDYTLPVISLPQSGFIGIVDESGNQTGFTLEIESGDTPELMMDDLRFDAGPVAVEGRSWGRVKALFE